MTSGNCYRCVALLRRLVACAQVDIDTVEKFETLRAAEQQYFVDMVKRCKDAGERVHMDPHGARSGEGSQQPGGAIACLWTWLQRGRACAAVRSCGVSGLLQQLPYRPAATLRPFTSLSCRCWPGDLPVGL